jgi:hypothetical protein
MVPNAASNAVLSTGKFSIEMVFPRMSWKMEVQSASMILFMILCKMDGIGTVFVVALWAMERRT